jgi:hypothetical protein
VGDLTKGETMKVYLDDLRTPPDGWILVRWPEDAIKLLKTGEVTDISLDHDLGDDDHNHGKGTGYHVLLWIEEEVALKGFKAPRMIVHSANGPARERMNRAIEAIVRMQCTIEAK